MLSIIAINLSSSFSLPTPPPPDVTQSLSFYFILQAIVRYYERDSESARSCMLWTTVCTITGIIYSLVGIFVIIVAVSIDANSIYNNYNNRTNNN